MTSLLGPPTANHREIEMESPSNREVGRTNPPGPLGLASLSFDADARSFSEVRSPSFEQPYSPEHPTFDALRFALSSLVRRDFPLFLGRHFCRHPRGSSFGCRGTRCFGIPGRDHPPNKDRSSSNRDWRASLHLGLARSVRYGKTLRGLLRPLTVGDRAAFQFWPQVGRPPVGQRDLQPFPAWPFRVVTHCISSREVGQENH